MLQILEFGDFTDGAEIVSLETYGGTESIIKKTLD